MNCQKTDLAFSFFFYPRERSLSVVNLFLDEMAKEAKNIITTICDEQCKLNDLLLPKHCASKIVTV